MEKHKLYRRTLQWAFPRRLKTMKEAWDGVEDYQSFLDRCATWQGQPVTAPEVEAKVAAYQEHIKKIEVEAHIRKVRSRVDNDPLVAALVSRQAKKEGTTPDIIISELAGEMP